MAIPTTIYERHTIHQSGKTDVKSLPTALQPLTGIQERVNLRVAKGILFTPKRVTLGRDKFLSRMNERNWTRGSLRKDMASLW
jgi:hypothetical protein